MRLLVDTQIVYWWQTGNPRLDPRARQTIESSDGGVFVSRVSLWELAIKVSVGKLAADLSKFAREVEGLGFSWLEITNEHILKVLELPNFADHKDPFDRLLVAQSAAEPLILLTTDQRLARYGDLVRVV